MAMRIHLYTAIVALAACWVLAAPSPPCPHKVKESVEPPRGWIKHAPAPSDHGITLRIALPQPNFSVLEQHLYEVSNPEHERYGQHLSKEQVEGLIAPHDESVSLVDEWLASHGLEESNLERSPARDWFTITIPIRLAEKMLDTQYHVWQHEESGEYIVRTTSYSLPENLHAHIELIQPTTMFTRWKGMKSTFIFEKDIQGNKIVPTVNNLNTLVGGGFGDSTDSHVDPSCNATITINCLLQLYNVNGYKPQATDKNSIGITGYLEEFANIEDLQAFYADQRPEALNTSFKFVSVNGGLNDQNISRAGAEANLDVQFAFGLSFPTPGVFWSTAGRPPFNPDAVTTTNTNEPYQDWLDFILKQDSIPPVISTSYGDDEQTVPFSYAKRACESFAQLGARGVSLLFSSGDGGVGDGSSDPATQKCFTNDGKNATRFIPLFPASCPYVTAVGGTNNVPEIAVFFSGGGFSNYFDRPWYQTFAVSNYLNNQLPKGTYQGLFNRNGRAIPDIAAQARRFRIHNRGSFTSIGGTSAAAPTFAALVALLNDARLVKGQTVLGFLNPLIYALGPLSFLGVFNDITEGNNPGCGTPGFKATEGWDPVTGFGTPDFSKLKQYLT